MPHDPTEPTDLILEQIHLMRSEMSARFDRVDQRFENLKQGISDIKEALRGLKLNTIAEVYKANLTVARFADHERRLQDLERRSH